MTCWIYKLIFPSGKVYIGQSVNIEDRWREHKSDAKKCFSTIKLNTITKLSSSFKKYKWEDISAEIIDICLPEELNDKEIQFISLYDSFHNGLNCTTGGFSKFFRSASTKQKLRDINIGKRGGVQSIPFFIDEVRYLSILDASCKLKIPQKTIHNRLRSNNVKYTNYRYEDEELIPIRHKRFVKSSQKVKIDGIVYDSVSEAAVALHMPSNTIFRRAKSSKEKFANYELIKLPLEL